MGKALIGGLLAVALGLVLFLAACGGGEEETLTKADYVRKGNTVCGKWQQARGERFGALNAKFKPPYSPQEKKEAVLFLLGPYQIAIDGLNELPPPSGEDQKVEKIIGAMEEGMARLRANPTVAVRSIETFKKGNELAESYGLKECIV